jgi:tRNA U34 5-carboxymethylaminomethyl modifying GTPase MnmE/TrmE
VRRVSLNPASSPCAFSNGRIDLMQAEAVADLIEAATPRRARHSISSMGR